jgi:DNA polymerase-1
MKTWLVLDCNYLCWRAFHSTGGLSYRGVMTGVVYGFMREVIQLKDLHNTDRIVFCFDYNRKDLKRREVYPGYKSSREHNNSHGLDKETHADVQKQIHYLRSVLLPGLGYRNILCEKGYEADDLVASVVDNLGTGHEAIVVARDGDYYQLLGPRCIIWNPSKGKAVTTKSFIKEYGISPSQWADVKAIAGCSTDDVEGIRGIGPKTAAAFLAGKLNVTSAKHRLIVHNHKIWKLNLPLVRLPYEGTPVVKLRKDKVNQKKWKQLCNKLGFRTLHDVHLGAGDGKAKAKKKQQGKRPSKGFGIRA